jgi:outer membrane receptor protein involved in Fe transport
MMRYPALSILLLCCVSASVDARSVGKIAGRVLDAGTKEPLIGVNVVIEGTTLGAATDLDGYYVILNVPPGVYNLKASAIGFHPSRVTNVRVSIGLTTTIDFELSEATIELQEEIVVVARRPLVLRDQTSASARVSSDQIRSFPVEDVQGLINLQAGVVEGHFRGGRSGEVLYLIDGIPVTDAYSGSAGIMAENHSIQELEVISGTFNAEYGQAMSGVVNQVTKDGGERYAGEVSAYVGDYVSNRSDLFMNINSLNPMDIYNAQANISGPLLSGGGITFFLSGRLYRNSGHLYGKRVFLPTDSSDFRSDDPLRWYVGASGDGAYVPMNPDKRTTIQAKITSTLFGSNKLRLNVLRQDRSYRHYDHRYKYNPDGTYHNFNKSTLASASYTHVFSPTTFAELQAAWFSNREDSYVYEDPYDLRYPDYRRKLMVSGPAFYVAGAEDLHFHRESRYWLANADIVSQITREHQIKSGVEVKKHRIWVYNFGIRNDQTTNFRPRPVYFGRSEFADVIIRPEQYAGYIQDKMEFNDLVVNLGIRFDYFDPKWNVLSEQLRLGRDKQLKRADPEYQLSPRFGLAFPITDRGVLHLSYGHFFQVPQFDLLYLNPAYNMNVTGAFQVGNPNLRSESTVAYELGLQQQLSDDIGLYLTVYYKDVRNLIGTEIFDIGNGNKYSQYVNRDYGNTRGFILSLVKRQTEGIGVTLDYTFQIAKGNASDPNSVFLDHQTDPPRESQKQLAPLDWDRRHSLNLTVTVGSPSDYTFTFISKLGSGLPYTPAFQNQRTGLLNSETRPSVITVDLYANKYLNPLGFPLTLFAKIYNLFDRANELNVFTDTGRASYSLEANFSGRPRGINTIEEFYTRPDFYSAPRQIILGFAVNF